MNNLPTRSFVSFTHFLYILQQDCPHVYLRALKCVSLHVRVYTTFHMLKPNLKALPSYIM